MQQMTEKATQDEAAPQLAREAFHLSREKPMRSLLFGVLALLAALAWVWFQRGGEGALLLAGIFLLVFAFWHWESSHETARAEADRNPKLIIDAESLEIAGFFSRPVPWSAIEKITLFGSRSGDMLTLKMETPEAYGFKPHIGHNLARMLGDRTITYSIEPLDCDRRQLADALRRHAPARLTDRL